MVVQELAALHFRNYVQVRVAFSPRFNILVGSNGQGKTNLVEALYFALQLDSFRTHTWEHLIAQGQSAAELLLRVSLGTIQSQIRVEVSRQGRKVWLDGQPVRTLSQHVASFFALVFNPDHLYLYRHFPAERRLAFNRYLCFVDASYLQALREFRIVQAQKNQLLRQADASSLPAWNQLFAERSHDIVKRRQELVTAVNGLLPGLFATLTGRPERLTLGYRASLQGEVPAALEQLRQQQAQELRLGHALLGPQRDDFRLSLGGAEGEAGAVRRESAFSQGEYRGAVLALHLALNQLLQDRTGFKPVVILDDVLSELDSQVRRRLLNALAGLSNQVFITTTEVVEPVHVAGARIMEIRAGRVVEERGIPA